MPQVYRFQGHRVSRSAAMGSALMSPLSGLAFGGSGGGSAPPSIAYIGLIASGCDFNTQTNGNTWFNSWTNHVAASDIAAIQIIPNGNFLNAVPESGNGAAMTGRVSVEYPIGGGSVNRITWPPAFQSGGDPTTFLAAIKSFAPSDQVTLSTLIPKGATFRVRQFGNQPNGIYYSGRPQTGSTGRVGASSAGAGNDCTIQGSTFVDNVFSVLGGTIPPLAIIGLTKSPAVVTVGDSIANGFGGLGGGSLSGASPTGDLRYGSVQSGYPTSAAFAYLNLSASGTYFTGASPTGWVASCPNKAALVALNIFSHFVVELGINGFGSAATVKTDAQNFIAAVIPATNSAGVATKVTMTTITPLSNSPTTLWTDVAGQTTTAANSAHVTYNGFVSGGSIIGNNNGFFDICSVFEHAAGDGLWKAPNSGRTLTDGSIGALSTTLSSPSGVFTAADVGTCISITGAGVAAAILYTRIVGFTNGTTVTVQTAASTPVVGTGTVSFSNCINDGEHPDGPGYALVFPSGAIDYAAKFVYP